MLRAMPVELVVLVTPPDGLGTHLPTGESMASSRASAKRLPVLRNQSLWASGSVEGSSPPRNIVGAASADSVKLSQDQTDDLRRLVRGEWLSAFCRGDL
jgi:hypothetical protein